MYKKDLYGKTIRKKIVFHGGFYMFGLIIALISGALMSIQGVFNTEVTKQSSTWTTSTFVQATGFLACLLIWLIAEREQSFTMLLKVSPRYLLLGGVIGAAITFTVIKSVASLGPSQSAMLIVASQSVVSYLIEVFGLFGVEKTGFAWVKLTASLCRHGGIAKAHQPPGIVPAARQHTRHGVNLAVCTLQRLP